MDITPPPPPLNNIGKDVRRICIYIATKFGVVNFNCTGVEDFGVCVWVRILVGCGEEILLGCVYRSPSSSKENNIKLEIMLRSIADMGHKRLLILGDINYPNRLGSVCVFGR